MGSKGELSFILVFNKLLDWEVEDVQRVLGKSVLLFELRVVEEMWFKTLSAVDGCEIDVVFYSEKWKIHRNEKIRNMYQNILIPCNCNNFLFIFLNGMTYNTPFITILNSILLIILHLSYIQVDHSERLHATFVILKM